MNVDREDIIQECKICIREEWHPPYSKIEKVGVNKSWESANWICFGQYAQHSTEVPNTSQHSLMIALDGAKYSCEVSSRHSKNTEIWPNRKVDTNLVLQSNNGRNCGSKQFNNHLDEEGIKRRFTVPCTPQKKGC